MADHTAIEWTDATWNVITGCSIVSSGCKGCYAMKLAGSRLQHHPSRVGLTQSSAAGPVWTGEVRFNEQWLRQPLNWKRARQIFVCAHGDLFHENVPNEWIDRVFAVMAMAGQHTFQVLTKRSRRMRDYMRRFVGGYGPIEKEVIALGGNPIDAIRHWPLRHVWMGVSCEDQERFDERIHDLLATSAAVRWISAEPLLSAIDMTAQLWGRAHPCAQCPRDADCYCGFEPRNRLDGEACIDWIVSGGESGVKARPSKPEWFRGIRDQCQAAGVAYLHKQNGEWVSVSEVAGEGDHHAFDDGATVRRIGKKKAGRLLDGALHDDYPEMRHG